MRKACVLLLVVTGCAAGGVSDSSPPVTETTVPPETTVASETTTTTIPGEDSVVPSTTLRRGDPVEPDSPPGNLEEATDQAIADLVTRTGASPDDIEVQVAETVTWNDGSLGCPEPGKMYTQALVPGLQVVLLLDDVEYSYHAADGRALFYCAVPADRPSTDL